MTPAGERELSDLGLAFVLRHFAEHAPGGVARSEDGLLLCAGGHPYPGAYCNAALRLEDGLAAESALRRAGDFFAPRRRGFALWVRDHADRDVQEAAESAGFFARPPVEGMPGMVGAAPRHAAVPDGAVVTRIVDAGDAGRYLGVVAGAYGMDGTPPGLLEAMFCSHAAVLAPNVAAFMATVDGRPAAGAMAVVGSGVAGLVWVATSPWARGGGLAAACAGRAMIGAAELGAEMAVLQSSQLGHGLWESLGFREVTRYRRYLAPPAAAVAA